MATEGKKTIDILGRNLDRAEKAWRYLLALVSHPNRVPWLLWQILGKRVHAGELLRLMPFAGWLQGRGIKTVLDAGAHSGEFSSAIHALVPGASIIAFEPQEAPCRAIRGRLGSRAKLVTFNVALSDRDGTATFYRSDFTKSSSLLPMADRHRQAFPWTASSEPIEVTVRSLASVTKGLDLPRPVLLKIDVQGSECALLEGAVACMERIDMVLLETSMVPLYEGDASFDTVYRWLVARGFRYAGSFDQLLDPRGGEVLQQDSLFVRDDGAG